ncbi:hypothetical protein J6590_056250 [Homalodisca vitripennis]|nr:hypothetical protein J6590_056250 [Homalodisca vitripennis]
MFFLWPRGSYVPSFNSLGFFYQKLSQDGQTDRQCYYFKKDLCVYIFVPERPSGLCGKELINKFASSFLQSWQELIEMIRKTISDESLDTAQIKEWYRRFKNCCTSVGSDPHSGRPSLTTPENINMCDLQLRVIVD